MTPFDSDDDVRPTLDPTQPELSLERQQAWDKAHNFNPNAPENQPKPTGDPVEPGQDQPH